MCSNWEIILIEAKYQGNYEDGREDNVVLDKWNQGICMTANTARCWTSSKEMTLKNCGQPHDEVLLTTDRRFKDYKAKDDRIIRTDRLLFRKKHYQNFFSKQLVDEVFLSLHWVLWKHPWVTKTIFAYRKNFSFMNLAQLIKKWVISCEHCIRESQIDIREHITAPKDTMQTDLVPQLPLLGDRDNKVTAMSAFSLM